MAKAAAVAREFVRRARAEGDPLVDRRLHALLYYAQGWSSVVRQQDLYPEDLRAGGDGPVVGGLIPLEELTGPPGLPAGEAAFVGAVWDAYKRHSAIGLADMTRRESPWMAANGEITVDLLADFFAKQDMPAAIADYARAFQAEEAEAARRLAELPTLDVTRLRAAAKGVTVRAASLTPTGS